MQEWQGIALTVTNQLHGDDSATGHESGECIIERLPLMHCIELLHLPKRQPAHLHLTALHRICFNAAFLPVWTMIRFPGHPATKSLWGSFVHV